uniref:CUB domain-containing protein n=1 Tax=Panagrellus redivivus TaxID=6233 RepID=A0A7E4VKC1_PANRE
MPFSGASKNLSSATGPVKHQSTTTSFSQASLDAVVVEVVAVVVVVIQLLPEAALSVAADDARCHHASSTLLLLALAHALTTEMSVLLLALRNHHDDDPDSGHRDMLIRGSVDAFSSAKSPPPTALSSSSTSTSTEFIDASPEGLLALVDDAVDNCREFQSGGMAGLNEFASPGFPHKYPANVDCVRVIFAPPSYDIVLGFKNIFQIEASYEDSLLKEPSTISANCPNDYLEVRDGRYSFSPLIGQFCGMRAPTSEIRARSGFMWLHFHSDNLLEYRGFMAEYEFLRGPVFGYGTFRPLDCFFTFEMPLDGYIDTTSFQTFYRDHRNSSGPLDCVWQVQVPKWLSVAVFAEEFSLAIPNQCQQNFLELYAGLTADAPLKRYCGVTANHVYSNHATVYIRIFGAGPAAVLNTKLRILFSTYIPLKNCSTHDLFSCGDDICIPRELVCNGHANCLYGRDEHTCGTVTEAKSILHSGYFSLLFFIIVVLVVVVFLFVWYRPCGHHEAKVDAYLKELCTAPPPGLNTYSRQRQRAASRRVNSLLVDFSLSAESSPSLTPRQHHEHCSVVGNGSCVTAASAGPEQRRNTDFLVPSRPRSIRSQRRLQSLQVSSLATTSYNHRGSGGTVIEVAELDESPMEAETSFCSGIPTHVV